MTRITVLTLCGVLALALSMPAAAQVAGPVTDLDPAAQLCIQIQDADIQPESDLGKFLLTVRAVCTRLDRIQDRAAQVDAAIAVQDEALAEVEERTVALTEALDILEPLDEEADEKLIELVAEMEALLDEYLVKQSAIQAEIARLQADRARLESYEAVLMERLREFVERLDDYRGGAG